MRLLLQNWQAPGDVLMLTAAVRDLHRAYPGRFRTAVESSCPELWFHNPNVVTQNRLGTPDRLIRCEYPLVHESNRRPFHFLHGFVQDLEKKLDLRIPVTEFKGDVHLSDEERRVPSSAGAVGWGGKYWIVVAGGKFDFTTKWWNPDWFQEVIDHFQGRIRFVQCGESSHRHPPLRHVLDLVGQTTLREFIRLVYWADGVICPVTFAMHLAAAVPGRASARLKPCIVIAGGREPPHWETYPAISFCTRSGRSTAAQPAAAGRVVVSPLATVMKRTILCVSGPCGFATICRLHNA
jgi:ADP-heptose:LPS heptosyltransferase